MAILKGNFRTNMAKIMWQKIYEFWSTKNGHLQIQMSMVE
jgi:hypothetical protein